MGWLRDRRTNREAAVVAAVDRIGARAGAEASVREISNETGLRVAVAARVADELEARGVLVSRVTWSPGPAFFTHRVYRTAPTGGS